MFGRLAATSTGAGTMVGDGFDTSSNADTRETYYHENQLAKYYADGLPDPKTGQNIGISATFRLTGVRAYVRASSQAMTTNEPPSSSAVPTYRALFRKAWITAVIIPDPPRKQGKDDEIPAPQDKEQKTVRN